MPAIFRSMHGRLFLLLLVGMIVATISTIMLTHSRQQEMFDRVRSQHLVSELSELFDMLEKAPPSQRPDIAQDFHDMGIRVRMASGIPPAINDPDEGLTDAMHQHQADLMFIAERPGLAPCDAGQVRWHRHRALSPLCQRAQLTLHDGSVAEMIIPLPPMRPDVYPTQVLSGILLFALSIGLLAWLVARIATRPLRQLAEAADRLDISRTNEPLPELGSREVRAATRAFNRMQQRIQEDVRERTGMLAAITHDLQTPLTRLRLRLEKLPDEALRDKLIGDMQAMQQMLQEGLELARSMDNNETRQLLDLDSLLDSLCSDATETGQAVSYGPRCPLQLKAYPLALRRALSNLIDNAVKYGQRAEVSLTRDTSHCRIRIRDHGPGIPADLLETVFTPFYRIEHSRSRETGGTGLGLAIARNIVLRHNGELKLSNLPEGGLEAEITLPLTA